MNDEAGRSDFDLVDGAFQSQGRTRAMQAIDESLLDVDRTIASGENLAGRLDLGGDTLGMEKLDDIVRGQSGERVAKESTRPTERLHDAGGVGIVGDVAASSAGHQDFDARLGVFLKQKGAEASLGGAGGGEQAGSACADDDDIPRSRVG